MRDMNEWWLPEDNPQDASDLGDIPMHFNGGTMENSSPVKHNSDIFSLIGKFLAGTIIILTCIGIFVTVVEMITSLVGRLWPIVQIVLWSCFVCIIYVLMPNNNTR